MKAAAAVAAVGVAGGGRKDCSSEIGVAYDD